MTYLDFLRQSDLPRADAKILLQYCSGLSYAQIVARADTEIAPPLQAALAQAVRRRKAGEPAAYIVGQKEFYGRMFAVSAAVLVPRPETEHLVDAVLSALPEDKVCTVWDLGCGSGIIAVTLKLARPHWRVWASDVSPAALAVARQNAHNLRAGVHFAEGSWFQAAANFVPAAGFAPRACDALVSNPPYIAADDAHLAADGVCCEPQNALTDFADGLSAVRTLAAGARAFLRENGQLWLEHGFDQGAPVRQILRENGFENVQTLRDYAGLERIGGGILPA